MVVTVEQYVNVAARQYVAKQYDGALHSCNQAIELDPLCARAYHGRGLLHVQLKKYKEALDDYQKARELTTTNAKLYIDSAELFYFLNNFEQSGICYRKAIELDHKYVETYQKRTQLLAHKALSLKRQGLEAEYIAAIKKITYFNPQYEHLRNSFSCFEKDFDEGFNIDSSPSFS